VTAPPEVVLTSSLEEFVRELKPGDVLLFDTLHPVSAAIKCAENRPVSHCALHTGGGAFLHVTGHAPDGATLQPGTGDALQPGTLETRLKSRDDRTVTARRHSTACGEDGAEWALTSATALLKESTAYSYLSLTSLAVPCFCRAYRRYLEAEGHDTPPWLRTILRTVEGQAVALVDITAAFAEEAEVGGMSSGKKTLTCSEFVYGCLSSSGRQVAVPDNLVQWRLDRLAPASRGGGLRTLSGATPVEFSPDLLDFNPALRAYPPHRGLSLRTAGSSDLARAAVKVVCDLLEYNVKHGKYGVPGRPLQHLAMSDGIVGAFVTPGDLWSSPSLDTVAVLHRPPSRADVGLDKLPAA
jgi:hypothetical protein